MLTAIHQGLSTVSTVQKHDLNALYEERGKIYTYLKGLDSTVVGTWVTYDELGVTTLLAANAIGPVAVAVGILVTGTYGWYQIFGKAVGLTSAAVADNADVYATATAGAVDDTVVAGDRVKGAKCRATIGSATTGVFQLWYPFMDDAVAA